MIRNFASTFHRVAAALTLLAGLAHAASTAHPTKAAGADGPAYADKKTQRLVERMLERHGGLSAWRALPSIRYEHEMLDPSNPADPWISIEAHDPRTRRTYHTWPRDEARIGYDGTRCWSVGWKRQNPPKMMATVSFFFLNLPWITQDAGVRLEAVGSREVPKISEERAMTAVRMTWPEGNPHEYYELYIDPRTNVLRGVAYTVVDPTLLKLFAPSGDVKFLGPLLKVYVDHEEHAGLLFPTRYDTYRNGNAYGVHWARAWSMDEPFDESELEMPEGASVDRSGS